MDKLSFIRDLPQTPKTIASIVSALIVILIFLQMRRGKDADRGPDWWQGLAALDAPQKIAVLSIAVLFCAGFQLLLWAGLPAKQKPPPPPEIPLTEDMIRTGIMRALADGRIADAVSLRRQLTSNADRDRECEHIFSYCVQNPSRIDLDVATTLVPECWANEEERANRRNMIAVAAARAGPGDR